jgi:ATP-dependent RNA helicase SUPV3L1/SUV3
MPSPPDGGSPALVKALLGPTNTGKTHRAIERMLEHPSGMIGLPLRLLAREVYDRVTARVGEAAVALVTGEEKRVPARPRYWVCTVEAMPERPVDFLAVDEIQLCAHRQRGHVFTDRLLHARGRRETWFLGAATMRPLCQRLVPAAEVESRPRLSTLSDLGSVPLAALPPRSAVVAFSAARVYQLGERLRAKRGGAAVVIGALSPRARNAQVALYQGGDVDYLVATDAIGMGLNLDLDCVVFAELRKFDGRETRGLDDAELAQIAGRAGRHHRDGRFGTLDPLPPLPPPTVRALERHRFPVEERAFWRTRAVDLGSPEALLASLKARPREHGLELAREAEDLRALQSLARHPEVLARARGSEQVGLLWEVCQVPDFRPQPMDDHFQLLAALYLQLGGPAARIGTDWIAARIARLDEVEGDLDTLLARMSAIRTWTYVAHHGRWVDDAAHWQGRTRTIEDRLSDALHAELVRRFVDPAPRRAGGRPAARPARVAGGGRSLAEQLRSRVAAPAEAAAAGGSSWLEALVAAPHERFRADEEGRVFDAAAPAEPPLGRLTRGADLLRPEVVLLRDALDGGARLRLGRRLLAWTRDLVEGLLAPVRTPEAERLGPAGRGLLYQLEQTLGTAPAHEARAQLGELEPADRSALGRLGIFLGRFVVYARALLEPEALRVRAALCAARLWPAPRAPLPPPGALAVPQDPAVPEALYAALGFPLFGGHAIRADVAEAVGRRVLEGARPVEIAGRLGCAALAAEEVMAAFDREGRGGRRRRPAAQGRRGG